MSEGTRLTELPALPGTIQATDRLYVVRGAESLRAAVSQLRMLAAQLSDSTPLGQALITAATPAAAQLALDLGALADRDTIGPAEIVDAAVTLAKLANLANGSLIIGDGSNRPSAFATSPLGRLLLAAVDAPAARAELELGATALLDLIGAGDIADASVLGRTLLTAADAAAAQQALGVRIGIHVQAAGSYGRIIGGSAVPVAHGGDTVATTLAICPLPAGTLATNGRLSIWALWSFAGSANAKAMQIRLGATTVLDVSTTSTTQRTFARTVDIIARNRTAQIAVAASDATGQGFGTATATLGAADLDADQTVAIIGQVADAGETIVLEAWQALVFNP